MAAASFPPGRLFTDRISSPITHFLFALSLTPVRRFIFCFHFVLALDRGIPQPALVDRRAVVDSMWEYVISDAC